ncbi:MAG: DNA-binding domain-containing protein, partial [Actinomycetota bacterium]|nr:DNA-binding domain-containing protein [Actinomycetota bacterium]
MPEVAELRRLQERMQSAITGGDAAAAEEVAGMVRGSDRLGAADRLELYRRSHTARLLEVMRVAHPALRHLLGEELFDAFALDYLRARPSRSYTLLRLGAGFAAHLAATREPDDAWADLVIDVARVE